MSSGPWLGISYDRKNYQEISSVTVGVATVPRIYVFAAIGKYINDYTKHKRSPYTINNEPTYFSNFYEFLLENEIYTIDEIKYEKLVEYQRKLKKTVSNSTINRQFNTFRHFFNILFIEEKISKNPCLKLKRLPEKKPVIDLWTEEDFWICYSKVSQRVKDIIHFISLSGARVCEAINLNWTDIDYDKRIIRLHTGKIKGEMREIILTKDIEKLLHTIPMSGNLVFGRGIRFTNYGLNQSVSRAVKKYCTNKKVRAKNLRHTYCTNKFKEGVPSGIIQGEMGHASLTTTERYKHLTKEDARKFIK